MFVMVPVNSTKGPLPPALTILESMNRIFDKYAFYDDDDDRDDPDFTAPSYTNFGHIEMFTSPVADDGLTASLVVVRDDRRRCMLCLDVVEDRIYDYKDPVRIADLFGIEDNDIRPIRPVTLVSSFGRSKTIAKDLGIDKYINIVSPKADDNDSEGTIAEYVMSHFDKASIENNGLKPFFVSFNDILDYGSITEDDIFLVEKVDREHILDAFMGAMGKVTEGVGEYHDMLVASTIIMAPLVSKHSREVEERLGVLAERNAELEGENSLMAETIEALTSHMRSVERNLAAETNRSERTLAALEREKTNLKKAESEIRRLQYAINLSDDEDDEDEVEEHREDNRDFIRGWFYFGLDDSPRPLPLADPPSTAPGSFAEAISWAADNLTMIHIEDRADADIKEVEGHKDSQTWVGNLVDALRLLDGWARTIAETEWDGTINQYRHEMHLPPLLSIAKNESKETKNNGRAKQARKRKCCKDVIGRSEDGTASFRPHIRLSSSGHGVNPRLHFLYGYDGRIHIGYIGRHLPLGTSKKF